MKTIPHEITIGEKYGPAMAITDQAEADAYYEACVRHCMAHGADREKAERVEKINLGYFAGYYDHETRLRVEQLFRCTHPILGAAADSISFADALLAGAKLMKGGAA